MKKITMLTLCCFLTFFCYCQITKDNWLVGGSASFSSLRSSSTAGIQFKQTSIQVSPIVGYFLIDKFAVGLKPSLLYGNNNVANSSTIFNIGPFIRYYFLKPESILNLFTESGYSYGINAAQGQTNNQSSNTFSFSGGPVLYFNSVVGMEFIIAYSTTKVVGFTGNNNEIRFGIGFQIHLEREK